jgi:hypothetical protein
MVGVPTRTKDRARYQRDHIGKRIELNAELLAEPVIRADAAVQLSSTMAKPMNGALFQLRRARKDLMHE